MEKNEELLLAAKLVHTGLVSQEEMETILAAVAASAERDTPVGLDEILLERGLVAPAELQSMLGIPLTETQPLSDYRFDKKIAEGGMAVVYLATYLPLSTPVALKIMRPELARQEKFRLRFLREAKLHMKLEHKNIVKGYEIRRADGFIFCALEHVDGVTVEDRLESDGPFDEALALHVTREVARALSYLDSRGVVHRDLKPGNFIITADSQVKIIDLGLAKLRGGMTRDSDEGLTVGTAEYLSPEQARGRDDVDIRSDIYSLGVSLFHMVVGEVPFKGENNMEVIAKQVLKTLESPALKARHVSAHVHYFIQKMMAKDRADRFQHPDEIVEAITEAVGPQVTPIDEPAVPKATALPRRGRRREGERRGRTRGRRPPRRGRRRR